MPSIVITSRWMVLFLLFSSSTVSQSAIIQDNGYSDVVIAINDRVIDPSNPLQNYNFIEELKNDITTASQVLFKATRRRAYFKDVIILIPSLWPQGSYNIDGNSNQFTFETADFRIVPLGRDLRPTTSQSGFCGVTGNYIEAPVQFFQSFDTNQRAKILIAEWSKYRYGVFDEIGRSNDIASPLFYTNSQGFKVLNSCNDTVIDGIVESDTSFKPDPTQTATSSLMAFPDLSSVEEFCDSSNHDQIAPTRQNLLCNYKSIWQVVEESEDFRNGQNPSLNGDIGETTFTILKVSRAPVIHVVVDVSDDMGVTGLSVARRRLQNIITSDFLPADASMAVSTFTGPDKGQGQYLEELCPLLNVVSNKTELDNCLSKLNVATADTTRDSGAAIRDAALDLFNYKDAGGSILYLVTAFMNQGSTVKELDMVELLLANNIQLIAVELVIDSQETRRNMRRIASVTDGYSFSSLTTNNWTPANSLAGDQLVQSSESPVVSEKKTVFKNEFTGVQSGDNSIQEEFTMPNDRGVDTILSIQSTNSGTVTVILTNSNANSFTFTSNFVPGVGTNWDIPSISYLYVESFNVTDTSTGLWSYEINYETNNLNQQSDIVIQLISAQNQVQIEYTSKIWTNTPVLDLSITPFVIIFAQVEGPTGRLTGLAIRTEVLKQEFGSTPIIIDLVEDLYSGGGVYSGVFRPTSDGVYAISGFFEAASTCIDPLGLCAPADFKDSLVSAAFVEVTGSSSVDPEKPPRITDLFLTVNDNSPQDQDLVITLTWTAPIFNPPLPPFPRTYQVRYSEDPNTLLTNFDTCTDVDEIALTPGLPGGMVVFEGSVIDGVNDIFYFAVRTIDSNDAESEISNIVSNEATTTADPDETTAPTTVDPDGIPSMSSSDVTVTDELTDSASSTTLDAMTTDIVNPSPSTSSSTESSTTPEITTTTMPSTSQETTSITPSITPNGSSSTVDSTSSTTEKTYIPIQQTPGFIIGMSLGLACLIGILVLLLICFCGNEEDKEPTPPPTVLSTPEIIPDHLLPRAYLRSTSYYDGVNMPYQKLGDESPKSGQSNADASYYV